MEVDEWAPAFAGVGKEEREWVLRQAQDERGGVVSKTWWEKEGGFQTRPYRCTDRGAGMARGSVEGYTGGVKILGIETSCDETAVAVVEDGRNLN